MIQVDVYADTTRTATGEPQKADAEERALELAEQVRKVLHVPQGGELEWAGLRVLSSTAGQDPEISTVPDGDGGGLCPDAFEVALG